MTTDAVNAVVAVDDNRALGTLTIKSVGETYVFTGPRAEVLRKSRELCASGSDPVAAYWLGVATALNLVSTPSKETPKHGEERKA